MQSRDATIWHSASSPVPSEVAPSVDILQPMKAFDIDDRMGASGASKLAKLEVGGQSTTACSLSERFTIYSKRLPGSGQTHVIDEQVAVRTGCPVPTDLWPYVLENVALINIMLLSVPQIASKSAAGTRSRLQTALVC